MKNNSFTREFKRVIEKQDPCQMVHALLLIKISLYHLNMTEEESVEINLNQLMAGRRKQQTINEISEKQAVELKKTLLHQVKKICSQHNLNDGFFTALSPKLVQALTRIAISSDNLALDIREFMNKNPRRTGSNFTPAVITELMQQLLRRCSKDKKLTTIFDPLARTGDLLFAYPPLPFTEMTLHPTEPHEKEMAVLFWDVVMLSYEELRYNENLLQQKVNIVSQLDFEKTDGLQYDAIISTVSLSTDQSPLKNILKEIPNSTDLASAIVEFSLKSITPKGVGILLIEDGFFHRKASGTKIREDLIKNDIVEMVIALPPDLYIKTSHFNANILVINKDKNDELKNKVQFCQVQQLKNFDNDDIKLLIDDIFKGRESSKTENRLNLTSEVVSTNDIIEKLFSLKPINYLSPKNQESLIPDLPKEEEKLTNIYQEWESLKRAFQHLNKQS